MTELVNLNTAELEELTILPGVGPAMADRIVAARPFEMLDDLLAVRGIGPALLERLEPLVTMATQAPAEEVILLSAEAETALPEEAATDDSAETPDIEGHPEEISAASDEVADTKFEEAAEPASEAIPQEKAIIKVETDQDQKPAADPKPVTRAQALVMSAGCSLVAFLMAFLLSIGVIGAINGGLRFAKPDLGPRLYNQIEVVNEQINLLQDDVDGLRTRLDGFEALNDEVSDLETVTEELGAVTAELEATTTELAAKLENTAEIVAEMNAQIEKLGFSSEQFQAFIEGLGDLLTNLMPPTPEETP